MLSPPAGSRCRSQQGDRCYLIFTSPARSSTGARDRETVEGAGGSGARGREFSESFPRRGSLFIGRHRGGQNLLIVAPRLLGQPHLSVTLGAPDEGAPPAAVVGMLFQQICQDTQCLGKVSRSPEKLGQIPINVCLNLRVPIGREFLDRAEGILKALTGLHMF